MSRGECHEARRRVCPLSRLWRPYSALVYARTSCDPWGCVAGWFLDARNRLTFGRLVRVEGKRRQADAVQRLATISTGGDCDGGMQYGIYALRIPSSIHACSPASNFCANL